jgi:uncharacterized protein
MTAILSAATDVVSATTDSTTVAIPQLSRRSIVAVWAAAALPMAAASWIVGPRLASSIDGPEAMFAGLSIALAAGLAWQFALVLVLVAREQHSLRWSVVRDALWLRSPVSPKTGRVGGEVWLVTIPLILVFAAKELLPALPMPDDRNLGLFFESDAGQQFLSGAWGWFALFVVSQFLNTVVGEELLFRGYLLPRMNTAFGDRDWVANGVLFGAYHLHVPWAIPNALLDMFILARPSKRYRSAWIGITVHSAQAVFFVIAGLALVAA